MIKKCLTGLIVIFWAFIQPIMAASPDRIQLWGAASWHLLGVNYPWYNYGHDFGTTAWGYDGVSAASSAAQVERDFADMKNHGVHVVRWFLFGDGRAAPEFNGSGLVIGYDDYFYADLDKAIEIAENNDIYLIPVIWDFHLADIATISNGVQLGGRSSVISNAQIRQSFFDRALKPLLQKYGQSHTIIAWDIMNEPEGAMNIPGGNWVGDPVSAEAMGTFVDAVAEYIHTYTSQYVTLGSATRGWLSLWTGSNLDFYQYHYYDHMEGTYPFDYPAADLGLDKPVIVGEFPTENTSRTLTQYLDTIWENGYAGSLAWSYRDVDDSSCFSCIEDDFASWSEAHQDAVSIVCVYPTLIGPKDSAYTKDATPVFRWNAISGMAKYQLQVDNNANFSSPSISVIRTSAAYTPTTSLPNGRHYWRIRAGTVDEVWEAWSTRWSFVVDTVPPTKPELMTPSNGASTVDTTPTLRWRAVTGAIKYLVQVDNNSDFSSPVAKQILTTTTYTSARVLATGRYYWRVRAYDRAGNMSGWSTRWSFRVTAGAEAFVVGTPTAITEMFIPTITPTGMPPQDEAVVEFPTLAPTEETVSPTPTPTAIIAYPLLRVESDQPVVQQSGVWTSHTTEAASGGSYLYSSGNFEDVLTLNFVGTQVEVIYVKHPVLGTFAVEIDGSVMQLVDSVAADSGFGAVTVVSGLAASSHTLRVYPVTGVIALDSFRVEAVSDVPASTTTPIPTQEVLPTRVPTDLSPDRPTLIPIATNTPLPVTLPIVETFDSGLNWLPTGAWTFDTQTAYQSAGWFAESVTRGQSSTLTFGLQIDLRTALNPELSFWQKMALANEDLFAVEVSLDGGLMWQALNQQMGQMTDWMQRVLDLSAYRGQVISLRFRLDTLNTLPEGAVTMGIWIDELAIQEALPTPTPTPLPTDDATATDLPPSTLVPTNTAVPTDIPTDIPTSTPVPTDIPTDAPTSTSTPTETALPTTTPTNTPTETPVPSEPAIPEQTEEATS